MKYLFILGRNIELSTEEVKSFFRRNDFQFKEIGLVNNGLLVETGNILPENSIDNLGGTVSIGQVLAEGKAKEISNEIDKQEIYFTEENKLNYVIFDFDAGDFNDVAFYLKQRFRRERLKATQKNLTGNIKLQNKEFVPNVASKNIDEQYFIFHDNFGRIIQKSNYEKIEQRDMRKPIRRNELSISPRLAKIMINLSEIKNDETLLDPFCGIGVILEEALLQNIQVIGIDKDKKAIEDSRANLKYFGFHENRYKLINEDSQKIRVEKVDAIVTEPQLGELQKEIPSREKAMQIAKNFENLIVPVLKNLKKETRGNIVFTMPHIFTGRSSSTSKERISCDINRIAKETGLKILMKPIHEFREDSIIGRDIVIMRKF